MSAGESFSTQYRLVARDESIVWVEDRVNVVTDPRRESRSAPRASSSMSPPQGGRAGAGRQRGALPQPRLQYSGCRLPLRDRLGLDDGVPQRRDRGARRLPPVRFHRKQGAGHTRAWCIRTTASCSRREVAACGQGRIGPTRPSTACCTATGPFATSSSAGRRSTRPRRASTSSTARSSIVTERKQGGEARG